MKEGDVGNKGIMFKKMLPYICPSNFWVIPFGHALLLGILQDFFKMMLPALTGSMADYCIKKEARNVMIARAAMIHSTIDFGRPYSDVVQKRGYWVMEELLHFTETWSVIIFQPYKKGSAIIPILHDKDTVEMWQSFRVIVHHFMRSFAEHASDAACDKVALHLRRYSSGVEKVFGPSQCKYNLHHVVALDQQRARGLTAEELEFWVENCIQLCKSTIKHRCSREPERLLVNSLLVRHALAVVKRDHGYRDGQPYVGTFDERIPEYKNAPLAVSVTDDGDDVTHTQLLGLGQDPAPEDWPVLLPSVQQAVQDYPELWQEHFSSLALEQCCITKFKRAQVRGGEIVLSEAYERITSRFSHFVVVEWEGEGIFVAKVKYFVKVDVAEQEGPFEGNSSNPVTGETTADDLEEFEKVFEVDVDCCFIESEPTDEISPAATLVAPNTIAANSHGRRSDSSAVLKLEDLGLISPGSMLNQSDAPPTWEDFTQRLQDQKTDDTATSPGEKRKQANKENKPEPSKAALKRKKSGLPEDVPDEGPEAAKKHLPQAPQSLTRFQQSLQLQQQRKKNSGLKPGTDKLTAAIQMPAAKKLSAQSVMAAQSSGRGRGGHGVAAAHGRAGNHGETDRGRGRVPSSLQQLFQLEETCDLKATTELTMSWR
ncbi:TPA: hypothetical protein ACH3X1_009208 [Trebouxia sp. C0004]